MLACVLLDVKELLKMKLQVALSSVLILVLIHQVTSQISNTSESSWTCICSTVHQEMQGSIIAGKCSGSCDCGPAVSTGNKWSCICDGGQLPYLATDNLNSDCFTSCNCSSGVVSDAHSPQKHIFSKTVVIILFVCLVLTTLACIASLVWYFYQKDKQRSQKILSEKASSYNSATDLIRHKSLPQPPSRFADSFMTDSFEGCISIASLLFRRKKGKICGAVIHFPYFELEQATNKFSDAKLIGVGGSSHVYSGHLIDGRTIAVKRLKASNELDSDSEFFREVELISRLHHCHIVPLLGYCSLSSGKQSDRLLVFEYMGNGNLRDWLDGATGKYLDWRTRISIALGAAKGLEYLHEAAAPRILHRDVKSTNILLDENWRAKVTDLGMAKRLSTDGSASYSSSPERIQGTFGYFAPEYAIVGKGSLKSDVFSFGVVLLELITGRAPIFSVSNIEESLVLWNLSLHNARSEQPARGRSVNQVEVVVDSEELKQMCPSRWSSRSLSLDADRNLFADSIAQPINLSAVQYIDRLLHLSATRMSNNTNGGDEVDLTQPRLETFCVENGH
ncbi:receptor-like serine/threonine-protein kinase NCRK isoform X5 [Silene latifolia]|uniref:receptor-like serine/threonine-protein kinase NCRK isoform X5 n=1 Tax=Silene latifolia TaxID=37657 RepID=UPI003D778805